MEKEILLNHGSGGRMMRELIHGIFISEFDNDILSAGTDSAILNIPSEDIAFTTDSYVVDPIFFPGGDIGKLSVCGTVNDLSVSGAIPKYITCSLIIEEGFHISDLRKIIKSIAITAKEAKVKIVTGDTKVVNKNKCDKIFINTAGIGLLDINRKSLSFGTNIRVGDKIIINGTIADHAMSILQAREDIKMSSQIFSDCAPLNHMINSVLKSGINVKFMRDATRGGIASVLSEIVEHKEFGILLDESTIPINENVRGMCEIFGFEPLHAANEGKIVMIVSDEDAENAIKIIQQNPYGKQAAIIGEITSQNQSKVILETEIGGRRILDMLAGEQLPRIC